ncbi:hypothetical protein [Actinomadura sp. HBU206391]|uniref:hypothetical protein n=1 Tax=Actinomadura sp. HBU206391 TaxID=2731692 RepID=UPI001C9BC343|nr:hypothetical protein [Actinomadura sp. HBU206391]
MFQADVAGGWPYSQPQPRRRRGALVIAGLLTAVCLVALVVAVVVLTSELTRPPTVAERNRAATAEVARRWEAWPAGKIFPDTVPYTLSVGGKESARRVGIGRDRACSGAVDAALATTLRTYGCRAVVRATYLDQLQGLAITVGVVAFPDVAKASAAVPRLPADKPAPGLRALPLPGSAASRFDDAARQEAAIRHRGPYVVIATIGYADGRPAAKIKQKQGYLKVVVPQLAESILGTLAAPARPDCSSSAWSC